jgi:copper ion binding protein
MVTKKSFSVLLILQMFFVACSGNNSHSNQTTINEGEIKTIEIPIEGMSCMSCVANVKQTLSNIDGVREVNVSLKEKKATVKFDNEKITQEQLVAAINKIGYTAGKPKELAE